jgi:hypothetical protein
MDAVYTTPSGATHIDRMAFPTYVGVVEYVLATQVVV